ncbi:MAG: hypothetical protein ACI38U_09315 [Corynebacterium sp.]|uniref:hypothetical protein n=1 Tax=Corynebacterium sp. TaxID=1720 RepID=UPI003F0C718F
MSEQTRQMRQVIWFFNPDHSHAVPPGEDSFMHRMIRAVCKADQRNRDRLYQAFPSVVWAVQVLQFDEDGYAKVAQSIDEDEEAPL